MVHLCLKVHLWRLERVVGREVNRDEKQPSLVGRIRRTDDRRIPVENIIITARPGAATRRRILL